MLHHPWCELASQLLEKLPAALRYVTDLESMKWTGWSYACGAGLSRHQERVLQWLPRSMTGVGGVADINAGGLDGAHGRIPGDRLLFAEQMVRPAVPLDPLGMPKHARWTCGVIGLNPLPASHLTAHYGYQVGADGMERLAMTVLLEENKNWYGDEYRL
jgi:hypothetical protein